jgi:O-acetylhomoserine (thiol)-lyase
MGENPRQFETVLVHGGLEPGPGGATAVPIVQSNAFAKATAEELENLFRGRAAGPIYTRMGNPTTAALERRLALLEGGGAALATASGMAAIATAVLTILRAGDEIVSSSSLFGGTYSLFRDTLPEYGISARFVDPLDLDGVRAAITERTRLVFVETIGNPKLDVPDVPALAEIAHAAGVPLLVDSTVTTPYLATGAQLGADLLAYSTSKYINGTGHGHRRGDHRPRGVRLGQREISALRRVPEALQAVCVHGAGAQAGAPGSGRVRGAVQFLPADGGAADAGAADGPALRERAGAGGIPAGASGGGVGEVSRAGRLAAPRGGGPAVRGARRRVADVRRGRQGGGLPGPQRPEAGEILASIGDAKTLAIHPGSTICADYSDEEKARLGAADDTIRVSVGIESPVDIVEDFRQALAGI